MRWALIVAVIVAGLSVRWPSRATGWVYEDEKAVQTAQTSGSRPVTRWTWTLTQTPYRAKVLNLALHLLATVLLWAFLRQLVDPLLALAVAGLWWVHPLAAEAVSYASGRADLLVLVGVLIACLSATSSRWWAVVGVVAGVAVAMASKESGVVSVGLVGLILMARGQYRWLLACAACGAMALGVVLWGYGGWSEAIYLPTVSLGQVFTIAPLAWFKIQATATVRLMALAVWPWLGQSVDYDYDRVRVGVQTICLASLGLVALVALYEWRNRLVSVGLLWVLIVSAPRWFVPTPMSYYNEHQFYAALPGMVMVLVALVVSLADALTRWSQSDVCHV